MAHAHRQLGQPSGRNAGRCQLVAHRPQPAEPRPGVVGVIHRRRQHHQPDQLGGLALGRRREDLADLVRGLRDGEQHQVLLGVTGSGKTFTMAKVIEQTQRPALILAPNKTLAAQLYSEFKSFFPENAVEFFVSYYDYYQPEAYVPRTDTYIEKDSSINEQIDRMRHAATRAILERDDVIVVASVSCIYGIGSVETYTAMTFTLEPGQRIDEKRLMADLVAQQYKRNDAAFERGTFRRRGDTLEIFPAHYEDRAWRISLFGDEIETITEFRPDLVMLDWMMPVMDGPTLFRQMKLSPDTSALPVVFITAKAAQRDLDELMKMGAAGTISKPFNPKDLPDQLRAIWAKLP